MARLNIEDHDWPKLDALGHIIGDADKAIGVFVRFLKLAQSFYVQDRSGVPVALFEAMPHFNLLVTTQLARVDEAGVYCWDPPTKQSRFEWLTSDSKSRAGKRSAEIRKGKHGSAQPSRRMTDEDDTPEISSFLEQLPNSPEQAPNRPEQTSNFDDAETASPEQNSNRTEQAVRACSESVPNSCRTESNVLPPISSSYLCRKQESTAPKPPRLSARGVRLAKRITRAQADAAFAELVAIGNRRSQGPPSTLAAAIATWRYGGIPGLELRFRTACNEKRLVAFERDLRADAQRYARMRNAEAKAAAQPDPEQTTPEPERANQ